MSIFPAYCAETSNKELQSKTVSAETSAEHGDWLENNTFVPENEILETENKLVDNQIELTSSTCKSLRKHKRKKRKSKNKQDKAPSQKNDFAGDESFYVDKKPSLTYKTIKTLHKPACPRYRLHNSSKLSYVKDMIKEIRPTKRYFRLLKTSEEDQQKATVTYDENEYTQRIGVLNRRIMETPSELQPWLDIIKLHECNSRKLSLIYLAEKRIEIIQRALVYHEKNEILYRLYIDTINETYPSFEISKIFDRLLAKDPYNYTLWTAQIMATQGSMARCNVPDVLRLYDRCMHKMHNSCVKVSGDIEASDDKVMLKLFYNCALFLRQSGLYENFFALIKLAIELNVSMKAFDNIVPLDSDQHSLLEYEELILQSGLPMNEIWLRIEKLRQDFNFLPCPVNMKCSDPQRIVFNEDVCNYIYPLKSKENCFYLMLLVLRLLKVPFVHSDCLSERFCTRVEHIGDSDAIEDILAACVRSTYALPLHYDYLTNLYELTKEMVVSPTFLSNNLGHEIYLRCVRQVLEDCATAFIDIDEQKRIIFILLWCRFERLLLMMQKCEKKLNTDFVKAGRTRFKDMLRRKENRDKISLYNEYAVYEFEALQQEDSLDAVKNIFENIIVANAEIEANSPDLNYTYLIYAEVLMARELHEEALQVLTSFALSYNVKSRESITFAKKLAAVQRVTEKLESIIVTESNVKIMELNQYFVSDYVISLIKIRTLMQYLLGKKLEALSYLDKLLNSFQQDSERHRFLRENIQECFSTLFHLPSINCIISNAFICEKLSEAVKQFPRNVFLLQNFTMLNCVPWYKIRSVMLRSPSILTVIFLIISARYRFVKMHCSLNCNVAGVIESDTGYKEIIVRNRILNMFQMLSPITTGRSKQTNNTLQRNALFWRLYLRCLSDQNTPFETSKKCLLSGLDECPWSKALYLDGSTYVPQELPHLQDLLIEKQLRIYALPEELQILREQ